jgi:hypothetical protein
MGGCTDLFEEFFGRLVFGTVFDLALDGSVDSFYLLVLLYRFFSLLF